MADYNVILGTNTADNLIVSNTAGDDSLSLLSGNDTVTGSGGVDRAVLGSGNDLLTQPGDYTGGSIFGGSGNDTLSTASKFDDSAFEGESNNDFIELTKASTTFSGVTLSGGLANDTITLVSTSTFKNSSVYGGGTSATSTDGADSITLGAVNSSFAQGNGGADTFNIAGTTTSTTVRGGKGNDKISAVGSVGLSYLAGDVGADTLVLTGAVASTTSVFGGSLNHTDTDSADSLYFTDTVQQSWVRVMLALTLLFNGAISNDTSIRGGQGGDFISAFPPSLSPKLLATRVLTLCSSVALSTKPLFTAAI